MSGFRLKEIDIIRSWVIIVLVAYHAFAPFTGSWPSPFPSENNIEGYYWLGKLLYSGMLETFVFISGYVFALSDSKYCYNIKQLIRKKISRLYLPCLVFGVVYVFILNGWQALLDVSNWISILNGVGHLWFLPMLLTCFVLEKFCLKYVGYRYSWFLLFLALLPLPLLPLNINSSFYYLFFFHIGYVLCLNREKIALFVDETLKYMPFVFIVYLFMFYAFTLIQERIELSSDIALLSKISYLSILKLFRIITSIIAVAIYYSSGIVISKCISEKALLRYGQIAKYSFGIYIFQQIVLMKLYYDTNYCGFVGNAFYPIGGGYHSSRTFLYS